MLYWSPSRDFFQTEVTPIYNFIFRLYMTTSMSNPHYLPAVYIQVNIINFTVTFEGLQEQLLSAVVRQVSSIQRLIHI
jgi:hypothetical protein